MPRKKDKISRESKQAVAQIAYIYLRVSTEKQKKDGRGLDAQLKECIACAERNSFTVASIETDADLSGKLPYSQRPALKKCMEDCAAGLAGAIIVYDQSRLARSQDVDVSIRQHAKEYDYGLFSARDNLDLTSEENDVNVEVFAMVNSIDRLAIVKRLRNGRRERAEYDGRGTAALPYGYTRTVVNDPTGHGKPIQTIIEDSAEVLEGLTRADVVRLILRLSDAGKSHNKIAGILNEKEIPSPYAGKVRMKGKRAGEPFSGIWSRGQIQGILRNNDLYRTGTKRWLYKRARGLNDDVYIEADIHWPILYTPAPELEQK